MTKQVTHLSQSDDEAALTALELSLERMLHGYHRWKAACLETVGDYQLGGDDITILNIVRMDDRPRKLGDIAGFLNRTDISNLQYAARKLVAAGLIEKVNGSSRKDTMYQATALGREVTDRYAETRRRLMVSRTAQALSPGSVAAAGDVAQALTGFYEAAAGVARTEKFGTR